MWRGVGGILVASSGLGKREILVSDEKLLDDGAKQKEQHDFFSQTKEGVPFPFFQLPVHATFLSRHAFLAFHKTKPNQTKPNQTKPNQIA